MIESAVGALVKDGCKDHCGSVSIPYPFGIGENCYMNKWFEVSCNETSTAPTTFLTSIEVEVLEISLADSQVHVKSPMMSVNYSGRTAGKVVKLAGSPFMFSEATTTFIAAGCNNSAVKSQIEPLIDACESTCKNKSSDPEWYCTAERCYESMIPSPLQVFNATFDREDSKECKLAFQADVEWNYSSDNNITDPNWQFKVYVPLVLDWGITMEETNGLYLNYDSPIWSVGGFSSPNFGFLNDFVKLRGCYDGYEGNPYLPYGCQDIDECKDPKHKPCGHLICENKPGTYVCKGNKAWPILLGISVGFGVVCLLTGTWWMYKILKKRKKMKLRKQFFKQNGGLLLQQQLSSTKKNIERTKVFSIKELEKATDNFNRDRILGQGGQGTVYKGMLVDGRIVAVKKSKVLDKKNVKEFINEVVLLMQINHRNIVKLLGCCLEIEVPMLVYEFIPNGTLFQYIQDQNEDIPLTWERRLQIAAEVASALSYLHSEASIPIYHRDVKSSNILLDEKYRAKVSDFGTSRLIAIDKTHLTTNVKGTFGYLDPEYFWSNQFTEKSDVYSFGVVLVELLTGEKAISLVGAEEEEARGLASHFILSMEEDNLFNILDPQLRESSAHGEITKVAKLAYRCLSLSGKQRPKMIEVAVELEQIRLLQNNSNSQQNHEETGYVKNEVTNQWDSASRGALSLDMEPLFSSEPWGSLEMQQSSNTI
ncbi:hypothetical protein SLEP1_g36130 [Rubroshorea leprosula]|uniref:Protein kinase domain-containing protein n=1 Tax=Rubroshorea leprosula TaxID=152421 RepID=A0AAV5KQH9_9ROSI|nr:hypothetical protein SLEP1_g36130 [Rubroshorea leprosula]